MDKSWINKSRVSSEYEVGVKQFLDFAFDHVALSGRISCPCKNCNNVWNHPREVVLEQKLMHECVRMREKLGHEPDKMHLFKVGHIRKKQGGTLDTSVQTALAAMERHLTQMLEETDSITAKDIAFTKVMGEDSHGRAQTYGLDVAPPSHRNDLSAEALADAERRVEKEWARRLLADETLTTLQEELRLVRQEQEQMKKEREEDRIVREEQRIQLLRFTKLMQSFENHIGSSLSFDSESTTC